jgi:hypothetical protein
MVAATTELLLKTADNKPEEHALQSATHEHERTASEHREARQEIEDY